MTHVYIDESGDLGMGAKGSEYFVIIAVKINDEKTNVQYKRIPKKVRERVLKKKLKKLSELKFSNSNENVRKAFLKRASALDVEIYALIIKKEHTNERLKKNLPILYNYLIKILLEKVLVDVDKNYRLDICLDECMSKSQKDNFESYIKTEFFHLFSCLPDLDIKHDTSENNEGLQVSDFICGAFGYKYNTDPGNEKYTAIIKSRIKAEKTGLFKERTTNPAYSS